SSTVDSFLTVLGMASSSSMGSSLTAPGVASGSMSVECGMLCGRWQLETRVESTNDLFTRAADIVPMCFMFGERWRVVGSDAAGDVGGGGGTRRDAPGA